MDVTLGPWTAEHPVNKPLADAMGDQARQTVDKAHGFTAKDYPKGNAKPSGYGISGRLTSAEKKGASVQVFSTFTIWVDGAPTNVPPIQGNGSAEGSNTAEDAVRAITEARINKILETLKTGRVLKAG